MLKIKNIQVQSGNELFTMKKWKKKFIALFLTYFHFFSSFYYFFCCFNFLTFYFFHHFEIMKEWKDEEYRNYPFLLLLYCGLKIYYTVKESERESFLSIEFFFFFIVIVKKKVVWWMWYCWWMMLAF